MISCFEQVNLLSRPRRHEQAASAANATVSPANAGKLRYGQIAQIMESGLHEFLTEHIDARWCSQRHRLHCILIIDATAVRHQTAYHYSRPDHYAIQTLRLDAAAA